ncbi:hypothetical protein ACFVUY_41230 [Kitasatospora sp. NPDC058063]|uniref:hypothetical protein n=1 Tax=unclassified Kitasatospora TaxID=2633591 RepID=UPI0036DC2D5A
MDLHPLRAAIERGDDTTVFEFLADVAIGGLDRDDGTTLLAASTTSTTSSSPVPPACDPTARASGACRPFTACAPAVADCACRRCYSPERRES